MKPPPIPIEPQPCGGVHVLGKKLGICSGCDDYDSALMGRKGAPAYKDAQGAWQCPERRFNGRRVVEIAASAE